eukprot:1679048-Pyramimonas_sp.AAC.2
MPIVYWRHTLDPCRLRAVPRQPCFVPRLARVGAARTNPLLFHAFQLGRAVVQGIYAFSGAVPRALPDIGRSSSGLATAGRLSYLGGA